VYNSTICLATRTLAKLQTVGRLAHACSTKLVCTLFMQIKRKIQFSTRNSILRIYWGSNLGKARLINFGLIQLRAIPGMKPLSKNY